MQELDAIAHTNTRTQKHIRNVVIMSHATTGRKVRVNVNTSNAELPTRPYRYGLRGSIEITNDGIGMEISDVTHMWPPVFVQPNPSHDYFLPFCWPSC